MSQGRLCLVHRRHVGMNCFIIDIKHRSQFHRASSVLLGSYNRVLVEQLTWLTGTSPICKGIASYSMALALDFLFTDLHIKVSQHGCSWRVVEQFHSFATPVLINKQEINGGSEASRNIVNINSNINIKKSPISGIHLVFMGTDFLWVISMSSVFSRVKQCLAAVPLICHTQGRYCSPHHTHQEVCQRHWSWRQRQLCWEQPQ